MKTDWIINKIFNDFPELKNKIESEEENGFVSQLYEKSELYEFPYTVVQDFNWFLIEIVEQEEINNEDEQLIQRCYKFIDEMLVSSEIQKDVELLNLIYLGILEAIFWIDGFQELAEKYLSGQGLVQYEYHKTAWLRYRSKI